MVTTNKPYKFPSFVYKLGIEMEGLFRDTITSNSNFHYDGSVEFSSDEIADLDNIPESDVDVNGDDYTTSVGNYVSGELVTPPYVKYDNLERFVRHNFPVLTNASCGSHFHVSFKKPIHYSAVIENAAELRKRMCESLSAWGLTNLSEASFTRLARRLDGSNTFCRPDDHYNILGENGLYGCSRYTMINATAIEKYGTIEFRLLPGFLNADELLSSIKLCLKIVDKFIKRYRQKTIRYAMIIEHDNEIFENNSYKSELEINENCFDPCVISDVPYWLTRGNNHLVYSRTSIPDYLGGQPGHNNTCITSFDLDHFP